MSRALHLLFALLPAVFVATSPLVGPDLAADAATLRRPLVRRMAPRPIVRVPGTYSTVPLDGVYGLTTELGVRRYQQLHGLAVTGVANTATMWSLGLVMTGNLHRGCAGTSVRDLQRALQYHDRTSGGLRRIGLMPRPHRRPEWPSRPTAQPVPVPTPAWPTFEPTVPALIPPVPVAVASPPAPLSALDGATLESYADAWFAPAPGGGSDPRWFGGGTLWRGDVGLGGEYTLAPDLGGQKAGDVIDGLVRWRGLSPLWLGAGYRGFAGETMGAFEVGLDQPLGADWLRLRLQTHAGSNFGAGWLSDSRAGLMVALGPVTVEGVYRAMVGDAFGGLTKMGFAYAPAVSAGLRF